MKNKIKLFREKKEMSQRSLAEKVGISQQHIQRLETGSQTIRLDLAIRICKALDSTLETIFPESKGFLKKLPITSKEEFIHAITHDEEVINAANEADIDVSPFNNYINVGIKSFKEEFIFSINSHEVNRLWAKLINNNSQDYIPFFVFETPISTVILNLNQIVYCHLLFDSGDVEEEDYPQEVRLLLPSLQKELKFEVNADKGNFEGFEDLKDEDFEMNQFSIFLADAEDIIEKDQFIHFTDFDGETIILKAEEIGLMEIPLWVTHPGIEDEN